MTTDARPYQSESTAIEIADENCIADRKVNTPKSQRSLVSPKTNRFVQRERYLYRLVYLRTRFCLLQTTFVHIIFAKNQLMCSLTLQLCSYSPEK